MSESDQRKEEDFQKQQEILRNRRDPNYNKKYMAEVKQRRTEARSVHMFYGHFRRGSRLPSHFLGLTARMWHRSST